MSQIIVEKFDPHGPFAGLILPPALIKRQRETRFIQRWSLSLREYLQLMRRPGARFGFPKWQRGTIQMAMFGVPTGGFVQLTGPKIFQDTTFSGTARCAVQFQNDGELWEINNFSPDTQYAGEWFSTEPQSGIGSDYAVRALSGGSGSWTGFAASDDTWITISATREWYVSRSSTGSTSASRTFEVGPQPSGPADDSAVITCTAVRDI